MRPSILISRENDVLRTTENKKYRFRGQKLPNLGSFFFLNSKPFKSYVTLDRIFWDALYTQIHFDQDLNVDPAKCTSTDPNRHHSVHFPLSKWLNFNNNPGGTLIYMHIPTQ